MICDVLRELRLSHNLSQRQVADDLHIIPQSYSRYELGQREPSMLQIRAFAQYYGVSADYLLSMTTEPTSAPASITLSTREQQVIHAYRKHPELQPAVDKLLDVQSIAILPSAARSPNSKGTDTIALTSAKEEQLRTAKAKNDKY